jgi:hypothetical protein
MKNAKNYKKYQTMKKNIKIQHLDKRNEFNVKQ